jgi:hypothetical protein
MKIKLKLFNQKYIGLFAFVIVFVAIGAYLLIGSHAETPFASAETESGTLANGASIVSDASASGGSSVKFGVSTTTSSGSSSGNFYGINWHPMWIDAAVQDSEIDLMQQAGIKSVRIDAEWGSIESSSGVYNQTYLDRLDNAISVLDSKGMDPLVVIADTPTWVSKPPSGDTYPEPPILSSNSVDPDCVATKVVCTPYNGVSAYDTFLTMLMKRWLGQVHEYEIWNEPDGGWSWYSTWNSDNYLTAATDSAIDYTTLLKSAYTTAKAIDPTVKILGGSMSGTALAQETFLKTMYAQGAEKYFDILSQHYYCDPPDDNYCGTTASTQRTQDDPVTIGNTFTKNIYPIMEANGDTNKPVWVTETGYNSYTAGGGVTEAQQGIFLTDSYEEAKTLPNVARLYWYEMDNTNTGTSTQNYYDIMQGSTYDVTSLTGYTLEPAYYALKALANP